MQPNTTVSNAEANANGLSCEARQGLAEVAQGRQKRLARTETACLAALATTQSPTTPLAIWAAGAPVF